VTSIFIAPQYEKSNTHNQCFMVEKRLSWRKSLPLMNNPVATH